MEDNLRIVITGIGPISAIGIGKESIWDSLVKGDRGLTLQDYFIDGKVCEKFYVHKIKNFNMTDFGIDDRILYDIELWKEDDKWEDLKYLLTVVKLALDDSKLIFDKEDTKNKIGLVLLHENPGLDEFYKNIIDASYRMLREKKFISKEKYFYRFFNKFKKQAYDLQTFMFLFHVAKAFGIHGYSLFVNNACASGLYALEAASDMIKSDKCKAVVVAGIDRSTIFKLLWFKGINMYSEDGKIRPFAKDRNGFVFGEGGAGIVLERLDFALERKAHIYAEYLGGGFSLEGWKVIIPNMMNDSYESALAEAIKKTRIRNDEIDLLVPHGVGTIITDNYEAKAITNIFSKNLSRPLITALKPYVGHNLGSCALLETAILMMIMENNFILPTLNVNEVDPKLHIELITEPQRYNIKTVMKSVCGFGGYNSACIFKKIE
jgi:3-oxoacyl-(acyl-carrier-protein) synthase